MDDVGDDTSGDDLSVATGQGVKDSSAVVGLTLTHVKTVST